MSELKIYQHPEPFKLENGSAIADFRIGYHTFGTLNDDKSNVVWVCHALTANSNVPEWWEKLVGDKGIVNTQDHYIVCANILGSCYGTTNPLNYDDPLRFPNFTMRDIINAHFCLKEHLGLENIFLCMGGSCGGQQVLEFAIMCPHPVENIFVIASSARETAWSIAIHTTQRMSIEADGTWGEKHPAAATAGLEAARGIGLLTYRSFQAFSETQTDANEKIADLKAESYIRYQGRKLSDRFNAYSYWYLTKALDTHNVGRNRGSVEEALQGIRSRALIIGIDSDVLIPFSEQELIANNISNSTLVKLKSKYGHDGFLIEQDRIRDELGKFLNL